MSDGPILGFVQKPYPEEALPFLPEGAEAVTAWTRFRGLHVVAILVTDDHSGPNGEVERHVSVSASTSGRRRLATIPEIEDAISVVGFSTQATCFSKGDLVHIYDSRAAEIEGE